VTWYEGEYLYTRGVTKQENCKSQMGNFVTRAFYHITHEHEGDKIDKGEVCDTHSTYEGNMIHMQNCLAKLKKRPFG
jgi:hypothetical protein